MPSALAIVAYEEGWPGEFDRIGLSLRRTLGGQAVRIDHIGSSGSFPG